MLIFTSVLVVLSSLHYEFCWIWWILAVLEIIQCGNLTVKVKNPYCKPINPYN